MKVLTKNLIHFAIFFTIGAIVFRYGLSHSLENHLFRLTWIIAIVYFFFNFGIGWFFGKKDYESLPLHDIGLRFHFATYILFNSVSEIWFLSRFQSQFENIKTVHYIALFWGIGLVIHFILYLNTRKNSIKGIYKSEIFE